MGDHAIREGVRPVRVIKLVLEENQAPSQNSLRGRNRRSPVEFPSPFASG